MNALQELQELDYTSRVKQYPNVPPHAIARARFCDSSANGLTKAILKFFELKGIKAWRQSSEGRYRPGKSYVDVIGRVRLMKGTFLPGTNRGHADVCAIVNGRFVALEVKMPGDRHRPEQKKFQKEVEASGGAYHIVESFEDFINKINSISQ